jgi:hypothetical protein
MMANRKTAVFWDVAPCSLVEIDRRFRGAYCLHQGSLMMEALSTSVTSVSFYETTLRNIPKDSRLVFDHFLPLPLYERVEPLLCDGLLLISSFVSSQHSNDSEAVQVKQIINQF